MENRTAPKIRLVFHKGDLKMKFIILIAVILATLTLGALQRGIHLTRQQLSDYRDLATHLEQDNQKLRDNIRTANTAEGIARIAQEELDLVSPDTIIFKTAPSN